LIVGEDKVVLHLVPSGILRPGTRCVLGQGMVVHPGTLLEEMDALAAGGLEISPARLIVSARCHVILPIHLAADEADERRRGAAGIGTTRRGIGPCYEDRAARRGLRVADLADPALVAARVEDATEVRRPLLERHGVAVPDPAATVETLRAAFDRLRPFVADGSREVHEDLDRGRNVLFEGAQGTLLDLDAGTYPYVTSSTTVAAGAWTGAGVAPFPGARVVGVCKAYATRVGNGPFPTEADDATASRIREEGGEYGATTGRPRRCGWFDAAAMRYAVRVNGLDGLALTKLDVLASLGSEIRVCTAYEVDGRTRPEIPLDALDRARPVYETIKGFDDRIRDVRSMEELPGAARRYVAAIERWVGVPVMLLSVGPRRSETILIDNPFHGAARARG
jgi:adenylosuccinate synthase